MISKIVHSYAALFLLCIFLSACATHQSVPTTYDATNKGKGQPFPIPPEFQNGNATLAQAKAWHYSLVDGDGPVQMTQADLTPTGRPAVFLYDPSHEGNGGHFYMVFEQTPRGLKYVGDIAGMFRAVTPDPAGNPRLIAYWHLGYNGNLIKLYTLTKGIFGKTAERSVDDHEDDNAADYQLVQDLFYSPAVSPATIARAFPITR